MDNKSFFDTMYVLLWDSRFWRAVLAVYLALLAFLSFNPWVRPKSTNEALSPDKIDHAVAYGGLVIVIYLCLHLSNGWLGLSRSRSWLVAMAGAMLIGILVEVGQSLFTSNRSGSGEDAIANAVGALLGFVVFRVMEHLFTRRGVA